MHRELSFNGFWVNDYVSSTPLQYAPHKDIMWCTTNTITVFQFQEETGQFQGDEIVSAREQSKAATFSKVVNKLWVLDAGSTKAVHAS